MITLKDFMETVNYRITEGSDYCWECYGSDAYMLDYWNQEQEGYTISIIFDTKTHTVYEACAYDYKRERAYRLINSLYKAAHDTESKNRDVNTKQAWDDVNFVDLETDEDFLEKARAILADEDYDTRVEVPLTLPDDSLFQLMKLAHEADLSLNQYVEQILRHAIENHQLAEELDDISIDEDMRDEYDFSNGVRKAPAMMTAKKKKKGKK